jgi:predicted membrane channel-forming protein YqfA (hemolysin III family)
MSNKDLIFKHRAKVKYSSIVILLAGIFLAYFYYGTEPHETIGGFLCGLGLGLFLIYVAINNKS